MFAAFARRGRRASRHPGQAAGPGRAQRDLPPVPRRRQLRRRPVRAPVPGRQRVRQPVGVLRRPEEDHHSRSGRDLRPRRRQRHAAALGSARRHSQLTGATSSTRWRPASATRPPSGSWSAAQRTCSARRCSSCCASGPSARADRAFLAGWELLDRWSGQRRRARPGARAPVRPRLGRSLPARGDRGRRRPRAAGGGAPRRHRRRARPSGPGCSPRSTVPVIDGYACLPTLGRLRVGGRPPSAVAVARGRLRRRATAGKWRVRLADPERRTPTGSRCGSCARVTFAVALEDTDPYRDCHQWPAAPRLPAGEAGALAASGSRRRGR